MLQIEIGNEGLQETRLSLRVHYFNGYFNLPRWRWRCMETPVHVGYSILNIEVA